MWLVTGLAIDRPNVMSAVVAPLMRPMKLLLVWQPTQASRPAPEASRVVTACMEVFHSAPLIWWVGASWHWVQAPDPVGTEMANGVPPDLACSLPAPWQFSH